MATLPSLECGLATKEGLLDAIDCINGLVDIPIHVIIGICIRLFKGDITIERTYLSGCQGHDVIIILHPRLHILH